MSKIIFNCPLGHFEPGTVELDLSSRINTFVGINNIGKSQLVKSVVSLGGGGFNISDRDGQIEALIELSHEKMQFFQDGLGITRSALRQELNLSNDTEFEIRKLFLKRHDHWQTRLHLENVGELPSHITASLIEEFFKVQSFGHTVAIAAERDFQNEKSWAIGTSEPYKESGGNMPQAFEYLENHLKAGRGILKKILEQLNSILAPEFEYLELICEQTASGPLINLKVKEDDYRSLNDLGSGIKTILQILFVLNGYNLIYGSSPTCLVIEELENNLHPRSIRRTIDIIIENTKQSDARLIFVTHSPVVMEHLATAHGATTHHVFQEEKKPRCLPVRSFKETCEALDTIGAKASDILQANFVIWVEGPTEQIVLPHLIKQLAPELVLGTDYIIALYGGKLLLHFSAEMPTEAGDHRIEVARLNRNYAFVMDNDAGVDGKIPTPGKRAIFEAQDRGVDFPIWKTKAREFEGIYPKEVFVATYGEVEDDKAFTEKNPSWGCKRIVEEAWPSKKDKQINKIDLAREAVKHEFLPTEKEDLEALTEIAEAIRFAKKS